MDATVLVASCVLRRPIHSAIWEDSQEVAPVAAIEELGLLVIA